MPLYECAANQSVLSSGQRERFAQAITAIHHEETGAPLEFIHVVFDDHAAGSVFTAGRPSAPLIVRGQIRAGRAQDVRERIISRVLDAASAFTGLPPMSILVAVLDVPAQWAMEGGRLLPEPELDAESEWLGVTRRSDHVTSLGS